VIAFNWKGSLGSGGEQHGYSALITLHDGNLVAAQLNDPAHLKKNQAKASL